MPLCSKESICVSDVIKRISPIIVIVDQSSFLRMAAWILKAKNETNTFDRGGRNIGEIEAAAMNVERLQEAKDG